MTINGKSLTDYILDILVTKGKRAAYDELDTLYSEGLDNEVCWQLHNLIKWW